jgi:hypothetical protein
VIILFVPISSMTSFSSSSTAAAHQSMFSLSEWLHLYHRPTLSQLQDYSDSSHHRFNITTASTRYGSSLHLYCCRSPHVSLHAITSSPPTVDTAAAADR